MAETVNVEVVEASPAPAPASAPPTSAPAPIPATAPTTSAAAAVKPLPSPFSLDGLEFCVGTWAWGASHAKPGFAPSPFQSKDNTDDANRECFKAFLSHGIRFFDTAEVYNSGFSEVVLGQVTNEAMSATPPPPQPVLVATKFMPMPWMLTSSCLKTHLQESLARLKLPYVDLYQVHSPGFSCRSVEVWAEEMALCFKQGLIRGVGVSNYNADQVQRTHAVLAKHGIPLLSNQVEYSLLHRMPETNGLFETCRKLNVKILAYSPLAMGRLTGKYTTKEQLENLDSARSFGQAPVEQLLPLLEKMKAIGAAHGGKTCSQVAINWVIRKGAIPICGAKSAAQATDNAGAVGWSITDEEVAQLDALSTPGNMTLFGKLWQNDTR